jgi:hypothetical protein
MRVQLAFYAVILSNSLMNAEADSGLNMVGEGDLRVLASSCTALLARVTLGLELQDLKTGAAVWTRSYTHDEPVNTKEISAVVAALNRNAQQSVSDACSSLDKYFASQPSK